MGLLDFFKPAWQSVDKEKALKAVSKEKSQKKLLKIAKKAPLDIVRKTAEKYLMSLMSGYGTQWELIKKTTDISVLEMVIKNTSWNDIEEKAIKKKLGLKMDLIENTNDQKLLADTAKNNDENHDVRCAAIKKINDQTVLKDIIIQLRNPAYSKLKFEEVRCAVVEKITDHLLLMDIVENENNANVRCSAFSNLYKTSNLSDEELKRIIKNIINFIDKGITEVDRISLTPIDEICTKFLDILSPNNYEKFNLKVEKGSEYVSDYFKYGYEDSWGGETYYWVKVYYMGTRVWNGSCLGGIYASH